VWAKKLSVERTSEGGGAIPVVTPVPACVLPSPLVIVTANQILAPHRSARGIRNVSTRGVHGNGEDWDPMGSLHGNGVRSAMGWEWDGSGN